jgi:hypothetical protein
LLGGRDGTSAGGRGGSSRKIEPNCAAAGVAASNAATTSQHAVSEERAIKTGLFRLGLK